MAFSPESLTIPQLFEHYTQILSEMRKRGIVRTFNTPFGDYAEWLVADRLGLRLAANSNAGFDAIDESTGIRYQVKCRHITPDNPSRQLGAIRNLAKRDFDFLIAVILDDQVQVKQVLKIPHEVIEQYARYRAHTNAHILSLRGGILSDPAIVDITEHFRD